MTAYDVRISDWGSDVCSSDLLGGSRARSGADPAGGGTGGGGGTWQRPLPYPMFLETPVAITGCTGEGGDMGQHVVIVGGGRSEESSVGNECVSTCKYRW